MIQGDNLTTRIKGGCSSAHNMQLYENAPTHTIGCTTLGWVKRHSAIYRKGKENEKPSEQQRKTRGILSDLGFEEQFVILQHFPLLNW